MNSPDAFKVASAWLSTCPGAAVEPNDVKLELYGLFKFATTGAGPIASRPGMFSMAARAKHDAWVAQAAKEPTVETARARYIEIATRIGWKGEGLNDDEDDVDLENLSDDDEKERKRIKELSTTGMGKRKGKEGVAGAMGGRVSLLSGEEAEIPCGTHPIHDAALDNDIDTLNKLLAEPGVRINELDEFGFTPLHLAADRGHFDAARVLLAAGADKTLKVDNETAAGLARAAGHEAVEELLMS